MIDRLPGLPAILAVSASVMLATSALAGIPLGISIPSGKSNAADLARFTKNTDITPRLVEISMDLPPTPSPIPLPAAEIESIRAINAVPIVVWMLPEPSIDDAWHDALRGLARDARTDGGEIWMRLAAPRREESSDANRVTDAFRKVAGVFRNEGADNVRWMFVADIGRPDGAEAALEVDAFPGADIVDVIGLRGLNWGDTRESRLHGWDSEWQSFRDLFDHPLAEWRALAPDKPIVAITATASTGGRKTEWVPDAVRTAADWKLAALVWFQRKETLDWAIQESIPREIMMEAQAQNRPLAK